MPYFLVRKKGVTRPTEVLVHAYGGFRAAQTPTYLTAQPYRSGPLGLFWAEQGGAFVLANIRGGGEYGPSWWRDALREKRQNSFDDLEAVARDLLKSGVAGRRHCHFRPIQRRRADRRSNHPASGPVRRGDHRIALVRHEALFAPARGCVVDR